MSPSLKVFLGPSVDDLKEISYNDDSSHAIQSSLFDGVVSVHIKGDFGDNNEIKDTYFNEESRATSTWSIGIQGRFLKGVNGNDILFGNVFDRPLNLPWGFGAILNLAKYVDPTLEHDLYGEKPWALSPFLSTMPYLQRIEIDPAAPVPACLSVPITEERSRPALAHGSESSPAARRKYFTVESHRKEVNFTPKDLIQADFVHGYLQFPSLTIALPGGVQFDLMYYYDERPVHFVCKKRGTEETFFVVSFTVIKDENGRNQGDNSDIAPLDSSDID
ncbi:unnamed protein product [Rhizoctonia solani]|uniref:Domain of unknown function at the cortex 1 domain-containing protein n=2 Tax=Rhizoctonia solani TaxID=456999 RepID=A0A8H2XHT0_9AGAM|nr:putative UPF0590 protein [Rhizoctonia solani 123E]CAE6425468.1 unnamed protein product [Rhizoctonia solani]